MLTTKMPHGNKDSWRPNRLVDAVTRDGPEARPASAMPMTWAPARAYGPSLGGRCTRRLCRNGPAAMEAHTSGWHARKTKPVKRAPRPRTPARVKKRTRRTRSHHHPELWGLGMVAVGIVLATIVDLGWDGGVVGVQVADGRRSAAGDAGYVVPLALTGVGGLMLVRSALVDFRPFQTGLALGSLGLLVALGSDSGGFLGRVIGGGLAHLIGGTGSVILGIALLLAGALLVTGASAGAAPARSGRAIRLAGLAARRSLEVFEDADGARARARATSSPSRP